MEDSSNDRPKGLVLYFRTIRKLEVCSQEEEQAIAQRVAQGDAEARRQLTERNLRLVDSIVRQYTQDPQLQLDLNQEGTIGLMHAVDKFDSHRNLRFSTYASWWIRGAIQQALRQRHVVHIPQYMHEKITTYETAMEKFFQAHGRWPTHEEVAQLCGWRPEEVAEIERVKAAYYTPPLGLDEGAESQGPTALSAEDQASQAQEERQVREKVQAALDGLGPRNAAICRRYYLDRKSCSSIAQEFKMTREAVKKVVQRALPRLRWRLEHGGSA